MKKVTIIIAIIMMTAVNISYAFEVDGFKDGMSKEMVLKKIKSYSFSKTVEGVDGLLMLYDDNFFDKYLPRYVLSFTEGNKLVSLNKYFQPSMANYILLFKELISKYGSKTYCNAGTRLDSAGEEKTISCSWRKDKEGISINYDVLTKNESLQVSYWADLDKYIPRKVK